VGFIILGNRSLSLFRRAFYALQITLSAPRLFLLYIHLGNLALAPCKENSISSFGFLHHMVAFFRDILPVLSAIVRDIYATGATGNEDALAAIDYTAFVAQWRLIGGSELKLLAELHP
jgi:hypothetical protein